MGTDLKKILAGLEIFRDLAPEEFDKIVDFLEIKKYGKDEEIFHEKSLESDLYVVLEGRVKVQVELTKMDKATFHTILPGKLFGEFSFIDGQPRSASAIATENSEVLKIPKDNLFALFKENPRIGYCVMGSLSRILARRIRQTAHELKSSLMWESST